ncbi:MAG: triose-phosphate isomerase [bacterium]|nr:triose-phosphate isomerase [bacterium]
MNKKKIIIANWKMKLSFAESISLAKQYTELLNEGNAGDNDVVACVSTMALSSISEIFRSSFVKLGGQDVFWEEKGSYTGEISAPILEELGCSYVIVGHSERRQYLLENYQMIHQKVKSVLSTSQITPIVCIGENLKERDPDKRDYVITDQLQQALGGIKLLPKQEIIVAYEPVWEIGTGQAIQPDDAATMHKIINVALIDLLGIDVTKHQIRVVYGGSVTGENSSDFTKLDHVDGLLIGGASLKAEEFAKIVASN